MEAEMMSLKVNDVWDLVKLPVGNKTIGSKWVCEVETDADGSVKARLVAQVFTQKYGIDFDETFCLVMKNKSVPFDGFVSSTAFLSETLEKEVYIQQPKGFVSQGEVGLL